MYFVVLQTANTTEARRHNEDVKSKAWADRASGQGKDVTEAKAMMLDNILEMLNTEELDTRNDWVRLVHYKNDTHKASEVEVF